MKPKLIALIAGLAMLIPALADAATAPNPKTSEPVRLTQELFQYSASGTPPVGGSNAYVGTSDGRIGTLSVRATVRGANSYRSGGNFEGKNTIFAPGGSIRLTFKATTVFAGRFAGRGRFTGGTGEYRGATGYFRFTTDEQNPTVFERTLSGWISLR